MQKSKQACSKNEDYRRSQAPVAPVKPLAPVKPVAPVNPVPPVAPVKPVEELATLVRRCETQQDPTSETFQSYLIKIEGNHKHVQAVMQVLLESEQIQPVKPIAPVNPVKPVAPEKPVSPVKPVKPVQDQTTPIKRGRIFPVNILTQGCNK